MSLDRTEIVLGIVVALESEGVVTDVSLSRVSQGPSVLSDVMCKLGDELTLIMVREDLDDVRVVISRGVRTVEDDVAVSGLDQYLRQAANQRNT
jgi:hypothetical protein